MTEVSTLFGWCSGPGKQDVKHDQCRGSFESRGVRHVCKCPNHGKDKKVRQVRRTSRIKESNHGNDVVM